MLFYIILGLILLWIILLYIRRSLIWIGPMLERFGPGPGPGPFLSDAQLSASDPQNVPTILAPIYSFIFGPEASDASLFGQYNIGTELQSEALLTELRSKYLSQLIPVTSGSQTWSIDWSAYDPLKSETASVLSQLPAALQVWVADFMSTIQRKMDAWVDRRLVLEFGLLEYMPVKCVAEEHVYFLTVHRQKAYYMYTYRIGYDDRGEIRLIDLVGNTSIDELQGIPGVPESTRRSPQYLNRDYDTGYPSVSAELDPALDRVENRMKDSLTDKRLNESVCFNREPIYKDGVPATTVLRDRLTKKDCERGRNFLGQPQFRGVMDKPCVTDWECPFYRSNRNYRNEFGKCRSGRCEMPKGVTSVGYRYYQKDREQDPMCYNCDPGSTEWKPSTELGRCCSEQMDRGRYPHLRGPDYAYVDDQEARMNHYVGLKCRVDGNGRQTCRS